MIIQKYASQEFPYVLLFHVVGLRFTIVTNTNLTFLEVKDEKMKNSNPENSITFSNYIRNVPIEDDEIMVSVDVISLYRNIPITDTLNIFKDYVNNENQFTRKTAIPL